EQCAFSPLTVNASGTRQDVQLQPIAVQGVIKSNLTGKGMARTVTGSASADASKKGTFSLNGVCPGDKLTMTADGYSMAKVTVGDSRGIEVVLPADPATNF